jgi:hypothetical protein
LITILTSFRVEYNVRGREFAYIDEVRVIGEGVSFVRSTQSRLNT